MKHPAPAEQKSHAKPVRVTRDTAGGTLVSVAEARSHLADHLGRVAYTGERVVIGKRGKPVAALVPISDLETLRALEDALDLEAARKARRAGGKSIPHEQVAALLGLRERR